MVETPIKSAPVKAQRAKSIAKSSTPRKGRVAKLSRATSPLVSAAMRAKGFAEAEVVTRWARIVGPELARATVPLRLAFPRGQRSGATLHIRAESAFAPILQQRAGFIVELVNRYLGYAAVERIQVKQGPLLMQERPVLKVKKELPAETQKTLDSLVGEGELSPLKLAVKSLGEYVLSGDNE